MSLSLIWFSSGSPRFSTESLLCYLEPLSLAFFKLYSLSLETHKHSTLLYRCFHFGFQSPAPWSLRNWHIHWERGGGEGGRMDECMLEASPSICTSLPNLAPFHLQAEVHDFIIVIVWYTVYTNPYSKTLYKTDTLGCNFPF